MLNNYLKIAFRLIMRNRSHSIINLIGLAVGLACVMLITLYIRDEFSYDRFHSDAERIYRVSENQQNNEGGVLETAISHSPLAPTLHAAYPSLEQVARILPISMTLALDNEQKFQEEGFSFADSSFLEMFDFPLVVGDAENALKAPFSLVLTEDLALKYYGTTDVLGKRIGVRSELKEYEFKITGVLKALPHNTHLAFDCLASFGSVNSIAPYFNSWYWPPCYTYVKVAPNFDTDKLAAELKDEFPIKYISDAHRANRTFSLQAVVDIHLHSQRGSEMRVNGSIEYLYLFVMIAVFILLIACINFMNLSTARSIKRAKEIGMRKVMGAVRGQLQLQFLGESAVMVVMASILALGLAELVIPFFNSFTGKAVSLLTHTDRTFWSITIVGLIGVTLLAGSYPALYLSRFRPIQVLKGKLTHSVAPNAHLNFRKGLVVFQFAVSSILIMASALVTRQINYLKNKNLGFDKEQVLIINLKDRQDQMYPEALKQRLLPHSQIDYISCSSAIPGISDNFYGFSVTSPELANDTLNMDIVFANDHDYLKALGMEIKQGRDFSESFGTDVNEAFVLNEQAAKKLGWTEPIEKPLTLSFFYQGQVNKEGRVIGVVKDFHYTSLHYNVEPVIIHIKPNTYYTEYMILHLNKQAQVSEVLSFCEKAWSTFSPNRPFDFFFLDTTFDNMYKREETLSTITRLFTFLAIFIACLGLFGLAAFSAEQRTQEIGIRKVLGASNSSLILLLSREFIRLVGIALLLAIPISYYFVQDWLTQFAYRMSIGSATFFVSAFTLLLISWLTISYHVWRTVKADPIEALRTE